VWCDGAKLNTCSADGQTITSVQCVTAGLCESKNTGTQNICHPPVCMPNDRRCDGAVLQICNSLQTGWDAVATCASAALCDKTKTACVAPTCTAGAKRCNGAQPEVCKADLTGWTASGTACASSALCNTTTFLCNPKVCNAGDKKCMGAQPMICNADFTAYIANGAVCPVMCDAPTASCIACTSGQTTCVGAQPKVCSADLSGYMNKGSACASAALCDPSNGTCKCAVGEHKCDVATNNWQICNASQTGFIDDVDCGAPGCNTTTNACNPATCTANKYRCTGTPPRTLQQCNATGTAWSTGTLCAAICDATGGECDECAAPQFDCVNNLKCSPAGHFAGKACDLTDTKCNPAGTCDPIMGQAGAPSAGAPGAGAPSAGAPSAGAPSAGAPGVSGGGSGGTLSGP